MGTLIAIANRKGGSGKTTTAVHMAAGLTDAGARVLLVDADPQSHATLWLGMRDKDNRTRGLYELLTDESTPPLSLISRKTGGPDLLAGSGELTRYEAENSHKKGAAYELARRIAPFIENYDFIIFDTPPTVGLLMVSVLTAVHGVFITLPMYFLSMEGLAEMVRLLYKINASGNKALRLRGIIPVMYDRRLKISENIRGEIRQVFGANTLMTPIRASVKLAEAPGFQKTIYEYDSENPAAEDYRLLCRTVLKMSKKEDKT